MSLVLRPLIKPETIPSLSRFAVVALYDAILTLGIDIKNMNIKAPNDLLVDGKKVAGVLVETRLGGSSFAVVGIGLNVLQQQSEFPTELRDRVTSLASVTGTEEIDRQTIVIALLQSLHERYQQLLHQPAELDLLWQSRLV
jgi:BirA family biotin operon repressor/biotin-[acetyl-CoA-carboxylase] ligase